MEQQEKKMGSFVGNTIREGIKYAKRTAPQLSPRSKEKALKIKESVKEQCDSYFKQREIKAERLAQQRGKSMLQGITCNEIQTLKSACLPGAIQEKKVVKHESSDDELEIIGFQPSTVKNAPPRGSLMAFVEKTKQQAKPTLPSIKDMLTFKSVVGKKETHSERFKQELTEKEILDDLDILFRKRPQYQSDSENEEDRLEKEPCAEDESQSEDELAVPKDVFAGERHGQDKYELDAYNDELVELSEGDLV